MDSPDEAPASLRRFIDTLLALREELDTDQFNCLREWLEFIADQQTVSH